MMDISEQIQSQIKLAPGFKTSATGFFTKEEFEELMNRHMNGEPVTAGFNPMVTVGVEYEVDVDTGKKDGYWVELELMGHDLAKNDA